MESPEEMAYQQAHIADNKQPGIIISQSIMLAAAWTAVTLRFIARRLIRVQYGADDWWILFAVICMTGYVTGMLLLVRFNYGRHTILVTDPVAFGKTILATEALYNPVIVGVKVSILCLYRRLFPLPKLRWALIVVGAVCVAYSVTQFFAVLFQCHPVRSIWDHTVPGTCIDIGKLILVMSIMNILTDVAILVLPLPIIWKLSMSKTRKAQVSGVLLMGVFVVTISIVRANYVLQTGQRDPAWLDVPGSEITGIEIGTAIVTACLPSYLPLINYLRRRMHGHEEKVRHGHPKPNVIVLHSRNQNPSSRWLASSMISRSRASKTDSDTSQDFHSQTGIGHGSLLEVEAQQLSADQYAELNNMYNMDQNIVVTKSVATESHMKPTKA